MGDRRKNYDVNQLDENEIYRTLLTACNKAFRQGVTSADIYDTLKLMDEKVSQFDKIATPSVWSLLFITLRGIVRAAILTLVTTVLLYWFMLHFFNITVWPLSELDESRCLLRSHPIIMEVLRPESNCSFCQDYGTSGTPVIEFQSRPTLEEFERVAYSSKPIIIRGIGIRTFNFKKLKRLFDSEPEAMVVDHCQFLPFRSTFTNLKDVFSTVQNDTKTSSSWYIGWSNCHLGMQRKLRKVFPRPDFFAKRFRAFFN